MTASQGVGLAIRRDLVDCLHDWKPHSSRLIQARLRHSRGCFSIFSCYAPTNAASEEEKDNFFCLLSTEIARVSRHDVVIVLGDMNATIGDDRQGYESTFGPCCDGPTNNNGYRTLDLAVTNDLKLAFSWFPHKEIHRITWYSNDGITRKTIDHILFSKRWNAVSDCRVFRSAELGCTDHRIVVAAVSIKLKRAHPKSTTNQRADVAKLVDPENSSLAANYSIAVSKRFSALQYMEDLSIEESYELFENVLVPTALEVIGPQKKRDHAWISDGSLQLVEDCRRTRLSGPQDIYRFLRKLRRKSLRSDRRKWFEKIAAKAEENFRKHNSRDLFKNIKEGFLQGLGIPLKLISLIRSFHDGICAQVRTEGKLSDPFLYTSGVRQGCVAAPNLFNVAIDHWMRKVKEMVPNFGVDFHGTVSDLWYADDVAIFASMMDIITGALNIMNRQAIPLSLQVNWAKTKILVPTAGDNTPRTLTMDNNATLDVVDDFIYLGSKIVNSCSSLPEIRRRFARAHSAFGRLETVWRRRAISLGLKLRLLNSLVLPVLLYGSETWTLSAESCNLIDVFHRKCLRRVLGIRWFHRVSNTQLYATSNNPVKTTTIRRSRLRLLGHVARLDERAPARRILEAACSTRVPRGWRRPRGRPQHSWTSQVSAVLPLQVAIRLAQDRRAFRELVATVT